MKNLIAFFARFHHWFLLLLLEGISGVLLFSYNSYQASVWLSSANVVVGKVLEMESRVTSFFGLRQANYELAQRNYYLERQVTQLRRLYAEQTGDTLVADRLERQVLEQYRLIPAKVVSNSVSQPNNLLTINKGSADGVEKDMGVVCGTGIVGVTYLVSSHYSVVIPVLNVASSNISCRIRHHNYFGYLHWDGRDPSVAYLEDVPRHAKFRKGDMVETSGYSAIFPPGVLVGKIEAAYNSHDGLSYRFKVRLSTDFGCLDDVSVINDSGMAERVHLMGAARDSLAIRSRE